MTSYEVEFTASALKEWHRLDATIRTQLGKKLKAILRNPHIPSARLAGGRHRYRIKLRKAGYRLGYQVFDDRLIIVVVGIGRRDKDEVYEVLERRWLPYDD